MAKQDLKDLPTAELKKKKTVATVLLWILLVVGLLNIVVGAFRGGPEIFAGIAILFGVGLPMFAGQKKVKAELQRRLGN